MLTEVWKSVFVAQCEMELKVLGSNSVNGVSRCLWSHEMMLNSEQSTVIKWCAYSVLFFVFYYTSGSNHFTVVQIGINLLLFAQRPVLFGLLLWSQNSDSPFTIFLQHQVCPPGTWRHTYIYPENTDLDETRRPKLGRECLKRLSVTLFLS